MTTLPAEHQSRLDRELDEGEKIRWFAQPLERVLVKGASDAGYGLVIVLSLFSAVFFIVGGLGVKGLMSDDPSSRADYWFMIGFGICMTLGSVVARWLMIRHARRTARNTIYAITNKRAIALTVNKDGSITERDYRGDELIHLVRHKKPDGTGTLTFESARGAGTSSSTASRHKFQAIEDVIEVERMLRTQFGDS